MKKWFIKLILPSFLILFSFGFLAPQSPIYAQSSGQLEELNKKIAEYEAELSRLRSQTNTLSNQIAQFDAQIRLTEVKISQTREKIILLGGRINELESSLSSLSAAFASRVVETYRLARFGRPFFFLLTARDLGEAFTHFHYLQKIQEADRDLLVRLQNAQNIYKEEKVDQEELEGELEEHQQVLGTQKSAKANLLLVTKNDERRYQGLLTKARAELEAIQSIIAGKGQETESGSVGEGQRIASVIPSASACSSGGHLHFEVVKDKAHQNPANFLQAKSVIWDNGPDSPFGFGGSWPWPVNDPIRITQGYGMTHYAANLKYYGGAPHTGIDMVNANSDTTVKSVNSGTLYRGAIACGGGTLRYVRVKQGDGYDTYYLHVNY